MTLFSSRSGKEERMVDTRHKLDPWSSPRPYTDASYRKMKHGPILPMEGSEPGLLERVIRFVFQR